MRNFKKRTIALVLASVITVAGSFASERYKNSLMGLSFETSENGAVSMVVQTKVGYSGSLNPVKRNANTYILTLPEMDSQAPTPDFIDNPYIKDVEIRTMPYTNSGNGYTRITVTTTNLQTLPVQHRIFLPDSDYNRQRERAKQAELRKKRQEEAEQRRIQEEEQRRLEEEIEKQRLEREEMERQEALKPKEVQKETTPEEPVVEKKAPEPIDISTTNATSQENNEAFLLILGVLLVILCSVFFFIKAKDKMVELSGESLDLDIKEEKKSKKATTSSKKSSKKINKIKNTIKTLDTTYAKTSSVPSKSEYTQPVQNNEPVVVEEENVVDLDKLFQEQIEAQKTEQNDNEDTDENAALEDFLSGFSFDEEYGQEVEEEPEELYDEELYEEILNGNFKFNSDDFECINQLMRMEIADEAIKNAKDYLISNPIKPKSKQKVLEDLMTTYAITQNINFTKKDVDALYKLINVEIDTDFITDLRTNPQRTKEVYEEIAKSKQKIAKPSEIVTLKVSDALPNLSDALEKQGDKKIKSDYKPETVYYSEGYDVSTLAVAEGLPDLSKEVENKDAYVSKPSAKVELVDNSYEIETLSISPDLQDLSEALKNPQKYEKEETEVVVADEKQMLENISQVKFKPFDDNSQNFEVLNDFDDFYAVDESDPNDVLTFEEIAAEFEELYSIKITNDSESESEENSEQKENTQEDISVDLIQQELARFFGTEQTTLDDSEEIVYNLESNASKEEPLAETINETPEIVAEPAVKHIEKPAEKLELVNLEQKEKKKIERERSKLSESMLNKIQEKRAQKELMGTTKREVAKTTTKKVEQPVENQTKICVIENESYDVLSVAAFGYNKGCYLTKNSKGYFVIGYIGDKLSQIKSYESLKSEKIQARVSENLENGATRYLVRIGIHKFILDVDNENINFVMDLC